MFSMHSCRRMWMAADAVCMLAGAQSEAVQLPQLLGKALEAAGSSPGSSAAAAKVWDLQAQFYAAMHMPAEQHAALLKQVSCHFHFQAQCH